MRVLLFLLLLWPLAAQAETDADLQEFLTAPANPLDLGITGDEAAAVTAMLGPSGGTLALQNAAGDAFVLTIPEGALLTDTAITAIPITASTGLPEGAGAISGLILKPDGLELAVAATLEITPKDPIPLESRLHWGFYEDGKDAFLHIPMQETDSIVIPIDHFSGAGVSFADRIDLQLDRWRQQRVEDRASTRIAEELRMDKAGLSGRDGSQTVAAIVNARSEVETGLRAIAMHPAATCSDIKTAIRTIQSMVGRMGLILAMGDGDGVELLMELMRRGVDLCLEEALQICLATGDLNPIVIYAIEYRRMVQAALMHGVDSSAEELSGIDSAVRAAMERCGRYKLTVKADGKWKDGAGVSGTTGYKVEVPIRIKFQGDDLFSYSLEGEAAPTEQSVTFVDEACWKLDRSYVDTPMKAVLQGLEFRQDHTPLRVTLHLRAAELMAVVTCPENKFRKTIEHDVAWSVWGVAHVRERIGWSFGLKTMKAGSHPKLFTTSWEGEGKADGLVASDTSALTLEHIGQ